MKRRHIIPTKVQALVGLIVQSSKTDSVCNIPVTPLECVWLALLLPEYHQSSNAVIITADSFLPTLINTAAKILHKLQQPNINTIYDVASINSPIGIQHNVTIISLPSSNIVVKAFEDVDYILITHHIPDTLFQSLSKLNIPLLYIDQPE
jgi:hypothetical protein